MSPIATRRADELTPRERGAVESFLGRSLEDDETVSLAVTGGHQATRPGDVSPEEQRAARLRLLRELADLPIQNPDERISARDLDRILYGEGS